MTNILHTSIVEKTELLADEGNSAYCHSNGAHKIKHNLWKLALRGHLNTDAQARDQTRNFSLMSTMPQPLGDCSTYTHHSKKVSHTLLRCILYLPTTLIKSFFD